MFCSFAEDIFSLAKKRSLILKNGFHPEDAFTALKIRLLLQNAKNALSLPGNFQKSRRG
jgi:hypothetical protein